MIAKLFLWLKGKEEYQSGFSEPEFRYIRVGKYNLIK